VAQSHPYHQPSNLCRGFSAKPPSSPRLQAARWLLAGHPMHPAAPMRPAAPRRLQVPPPPLPRNPIPHFSPFPAVLKPPENLNPNLLPAGTLLDSPPASVLGHRRSLQRNRGEPPRRLVPLAPPLSLCSVPASCTCSCRRRTPSPATRRGPIRGGAATR
jgi:hypothetical protein